MAQLDYVQGQKFGEWTVIEYVGDCKWKCKCSCNNIGIVRGADLRSGASVKCKSHPKINKVGQTFGTLKCMEYIPPNKAEYVDASYRFECINCGKVYYIKTRNANEKYIRKCECQSKRDKLDDLTGQQFGYLKVEKYIGNKEYDCICVCKEHKIVKRHHLINGDTKSCGCKSNELFKNTINNKYGETNISKIKNPREQWQIDAVSSREALLSYISKFDEKPSINDLCDMLKLNKTNMYLKIHEYSLDDCIKVDYSQSNGEEQLAGFLSTITNIQQHNKSIINPYEIDIYIPDKKLAIEYNGLYWHSELHKDKYYHQQKTIDCAKKGIRLIHIFEDEWINNNDKIKDFLYNIINTNKETIGARNTYIKQVDDSEYVEFVNRYHLKGSRGAEIKLGCYLNENNELLGIMSFGKPRFNNNYQYELVRLCWKSGIAVIGGTEKMFNYFVNKYDPYSVITYSDIAKFTGNVYTKIGFEPIQPNPITEPNYIWSDGENTISRYQTQKHKLIEQGLGTENQTEDDIMHNRGFFKVYDSGNIKLSWKRR